MIAPSDEDRQQITIEDKKQSCAEGCDEGVDGEGTGKEIPPEMLGGLEAPASDDASIDQDDDEAYDDGEEDFVPQPSSIQPIIYQDDTQDSYFLQHFNFDENGFKPD